MIARTTRAILILCLAAHAAIGSASDIDKIVRQQYENRIVALRHAVTSDTQVFDANGRLLSSNTEGPWNAFGCVKIAKLEITPDKITLAASRVTYRFNDFTGSFVGQNQSNQIVAIEVRLDRPLASAEEAALILGKVFAPFDAAAPDPALGYWLARERARVSVSAKPANRVLLGNGVFRVGDDGVTAPVPVYMPEPEFSDKARKAKFGGTVVLGVIVDHTGNVSKVWVERPLGMDLDEMAVDKVKTWRFQPAQRQGQPVAVSMQIEVSFNLYTKPKP
ncbi:MAG: energy transducer TonB [Acidobacteriia bacterium]|nr:energy transducer TonB [Terriglobia bacterium]